MIGSLLGRSPRLPHEPVEDVARRADYQRLIDGAHADGPRGRVVLAVYTLDLDLGRGDLYVAAGLGLALVERGYGVLLLARPEWRLAEQADVWVAMIPTADPSMAPAGAWKVAWVRNETESWAAQSHLAGFDQVIASSQLSADRLSRETPRAGGVLRIGVDTALFTPPDDDADRLATAVTTAHFWGTERDAHRALMQLPDDADVAMYGHAKAAPKALLRWHREPVSYFALPDVYRRCSVVIDDMNATTLGFGSLNSRFFESAACGSLPLVNGLLGVRELGVPDPPHYTDAGSLTQRLAELRADPAALADRARELGATVRAEHSWSHRADEFVALVEAARAADVPAAPAHPVHFFPDYSSGNPYQAMLHARLADVDAYPVPVEHLLRHLRRTAEAPGNPGTLSVHWTLPILQWVLGPFRARLMLDRVTVALDEFIEAGGRLMWTVHNVLPHDTRHRWAEIELANVLADRAERIQILSEATLEAVGDLYHLDPAKVVLIEHSSYTGAYPDWISRDVARSRLGLLPGEKALLALGGIRPYKGLDDLLDVFDVLLEQDQTLRLLIAGRPIDEEATARVKARCEAHPRVVSLFEAVPDDQLQVWMKAADLAVLPYRDILNSGAFLLAQTFGLPVVGPRAGALVESADESHVRLFEPQVPSSLATAIRSALDAVVLDRDGLAANARRRAEELSPDAMATAFAAAVQPLLDPR